MTTTTLLRWILLGETGVYLVFAGVLMQLPDWNWGRIGALLLLLACGVRAAIVGVTFVFAWIFRAPLARACTISSRQSIMMFLRELGALFVLFSIVMPFERCLMRPDRLTPRGGGRPPLLLIHGYLCNRGYWWRLRSHLERAGWQVATISLRPAFGAVDGNVPQVMQRIDEIRARTGSARVIVIGHSMGGLVARACLQRYGGAGIAALITLGSPHHGSRLAVLGVGPNARQMLPGSPWLATITQPGDAPPCVAIYSCHDNFVMPQDSARFEGARTVALTGIGHLEMAFSPPLRRTLLEQLELLSNA